MALIPKDWRNLPSTTTPLSAEALEDLEQRLGDYADTITGSGIPVTTGTTKGDTVVYTAANTPARQAVGAKGLVPLSDPSTSTGLRYHRPMGWHNVVEEFGASNNDTNATATTAAIQATVNAVAAAGGGVVYFPPGIYQTNSPITVPPSVPIAFRGSAMSGSVSSFDFVSRIRVNHNGRGVTCTGVAGTSRGQLDIHNLAIYGSRSNTGTLLHLENVGTSLWERVRVENTAGYGIYWSGVWNCAAYQVFVTGCGDAGTTQPASVITGPSSAPSSAYGTNTFHLTDCEWESNHGTDVKFTGDVTIGTRCVGVFVTAPKAEFQTGFPSHPIWDFGYCGDVKITGGFSYMGTGSHAHVVTSVDHNQVKDIAINGHHFTTAQSWAGNYFTNQDFGCLSFDGGCSFSGNPANAYHRVAPTVPAAGFLLGETNQYGTSVRVDDQRSGTRTLKTGYRTLYGGTGSPEGVVTARIGDEYINLSGGAATTKYVKTSGTGAAPTNTGWVAL